MRYFAKIALVPALSTAVVGWVFAGYNDDSCASSGGTSYYSLDGSGGESGCITFPKDIPGNLDCIFFTNGGDDRGSCSTGTFTHPRSYVLNGGSCTVWHGAGCTGAYSGISSSNGCRSVFNPDQNWGSMKCQDS